MAMKKRFFSFDVFDTLITRKTATPQGVFFVMQDKMLHEAKYNCLDRAIKESFAELRIHAEELVLAPYLHDA